MLIGAHTILYSTDPEAAVSDEGWGLLTHVTLPGGSKLGIYEPRYARPEAMPLAK